MLIGSDFLPLVPAGGSVVAETTWDTTGYVGENEIQVILDIADQLEELDEDNNSASTSVTVRSRPDLHVPEIELSDPEPVTGETITLQTVIGNSGETAAGASVLALYDGNPDDGGAVICEQAVSVPAQGETTVNCLWTPASPGLHRLFVLSDRDNAVSENDEGNNLTWRDLYVGLAGPLLRRQRQPGGRS